MKSKYFNSEYKKPLCVDIEDVKFHKLHKNDDDENNNKNIKSNLGEHLEVKNAENKNKNDKLDSKWAKECRSLISKILPPTVMMTLKVL